MQYPGNTDTDQCLDIRGINDLKDEELERLNALLPWAAFVLDRQGRNFGQAYSPKKRNDPQAIPDRRIIELDRRYGLAGKYVLEAGCFEGIHTVGLLQKGQRFPRSTAASRMSSRRWCAAGPLMFMPMYFSGTWRKTGHGLPVSSVTSSTTSVCSTT